MAAGKPNAGQDSKNAHERKVLEDILFFARSKGGEGRRNADRLAGSIDEKRERPDLAIVADCGRLVGLEHFRVDHHVRHDKRAQSKSAEFSNKYEEERKKAIATNDEDDWLEAMVDIIGRAMTEGIRNKKNACLSDLTTSFEKRISDSEMGHAPKLNDYRINLAERYGETASLELGYLIEVHSDFKDLFLNCRRGINRLESGKMPLFSEIYNILAKAAEEVNWILLGFYEPLGSTIKDAAIVKCSNGSFAKSAARQGFSRTEYLGLGKTEPFRKQNRIGSHDAVISGENIEFAIEDTSKPMDGRLMLDNALCDTAKALDLSRTEKPFTATIPVQMLYETVHDVAKVHKGAFTTKVVEGLLWKMPQGENTDRINAFGKRHGIEPR